MIDAFIKLFENPAIASGATFLCTLLGGYLKRKVDLRAMRLEEEEKLARAELRLKALEVTGRIELLSEQRKQLGYAPTPTETKLSTAKTELAATGAHATAIAQAIEEVLPYAREQAKQVRAQSVLPPTHGPSGEHPTAMPPRSPTGFSGDSFPAVLPKDVATLDDGDDR